MDNINWSIPEELRDKVSIVKLDRGKRYIHNYNIKFQPKMFYILIIDTDDRMVIGLYDMYSNSQIYQEETFQVFREKFIGNIEEQIGLKLNFEFEMWSKHYLLFCYDKKQQKFTTTRPNFSLSHYLATLYKYNIIWWKSLLPEFAKTLNVEEREEIGDIVGRAFFCQETTEEWNHVQSVVNCYSRY